MKLRAIYTIEIIEINGKKVIDIPSNAETRPLIFSFNKLLEYFNKEIKKYFESKRVKINLTQKIETG
jgi:hypothetical protein